VWNGLRALAATFKRKDLIAFLETFSLVASLVLAFVLAVQFSFEPPYIVEADKRYLEQIIYNRSLSQQEIDNYYSSQALTHNQYFPADQFYAYSRFLGSNSDIYIREETQSAFGTWTKCFSSQTYTRGVDHAYCMLPSYRLFFYGNSATSILIACLLAAITIYLVLIASSKCLDDLETYKTFAVFIVPVIIAFFIIGFVGITYFFGQMRVVNQIIMPRWNAEALAYPLYNDLFYYIYIPLLGFVALGLFVAFFLQRYLRRQYTFKEYYEESLYDAGMNNPDVTDFFLRNPTIFNENLKDYGFTNGSDRARIYQGLSRTRVVSGADSTMSLLGGEKKVSSFKSVLIQMSVLDRNKKILEAAGLSKSDLKTLAKFPNYLEKVLSNAGVTSAEERLRIIIELNCSENEKGAGRKSKSVSRTNSHRVLKLDARTSNGMKQLKAPIPELNKKEETPSSELKKEEAPSLELKPAAQSI